MRNTLLTVSLCVVFFVSCGHKPTAQENAVSMADQQKIEKFIKHFYSLSDEERKKLLTDKARTIYEHAALFNFGFEGGYNGQGGIGQVYPNTIKILDIDSTTGVVTFTQEVQVVGFQGAELVYSERRKEKYSLWLKNDNGFLLVDDIEAPFNEERLSKYQDY